MAGDTPVSAGIMPGALKVLVPIPADYFGKASG
jgi:hypothetical protein